MSTYNLATVRAAVYTQLQTLTGAGQPFQIVYDNDPALISGFPAAILRQSKIKNDYLDDQSNLDIIEFSIWIIQEITQAGQAAAKGIVDSCATTLINTFQKYANIALGGSVDFVEPVNGSSGQIQTPNGIAYYQEIILKCDIAGTIQ